MQALQPTVVWTATPDPFELYGVEEDSRSSRVHGLSAELRRAKLRNCRTAHHVLPSHECYLGVMRFLPWRDDPPCLVWLLFP